MKFARPIAFLALVFAACGVAHATEFRSVGAAPAVLYDAPTEKGRKVFIAPRGMPVEVVLTYGAWTKVRDASGDLSWIESKMLSPRRSVIVSAASAKVRTAADDNAPLVFTADKGVLLELADPVASSWIRVRHRDGQAGFVKAAEIWGE
ncbi:SH3 domain-containing protein [Noviherbaspirillum massiliense]|uniref:SH3 domain-containing protein n=1 Tax=Noviherbaspirillum massiliense TaxID=1465823 RepID=UPI00031D198A|nr:SH3 domain-containing protein [Noviherbaspirillum massiliense]